MQLRIATSVPVQANYIVFFFCFLYIYPHIEYVHLVILSHTLEINFCSATTLLYEEGTKNWLF